METKKVYMQPEMRTVVMAMPSALLAGSTTSLITPVGSGGIEGQDWTDE